jgi:ribosomal protein L34
MVRRIRRLRPVRLQRVAAFGFLAAERDAGAHALGDEFHQPLDHPLVRVDPGAGQHFAAVARPRPAGDLLGPVAIFLVVGDGVIQRRKHHGREQLARALALFEVEGGAVDGIEHH